MEQNIYVEIGKPCIAERWEVMQKECKGKLHYHDSYEIYILEEGSRRYVIEGTILDLSVGDVALIRPCELHSTGGVDFEGF